MTSLIVTGCDIETTGFEASQGHRITEISLDTYELDVATMTFKKRLNFHTMVNPLRSIPAEVQALTSITPDIVKSAPDWNTVGPKVARIIGVTDLFVAHNVNFDAPFLAYEIVRIGEKINLDMPTFCTMLNGRFATPLGKVPRLAELCWALGVDFDADAAHRANYDTDRMMEALMVGVKAGYFNLQPIAQSLLAKKSAASVKEDAA